MTTALITADEPYSHRLAAAYIQDFKNARKNAGLAPVSGSTETETKIPYIHFLMPLESQPDDVIQIVKMACDASQSYGTLVFNVGDGGANYQATEVYDSGWVNLSPNDHFKLGGRNVKKVFVDVFYDVAPSHPGRITRSELQTDLRGCSNSSRLVRWDKYRELCKVVQEAKLQKVVFLACSGGHTKNLVRKISSDFKTKCEATRSSIQPTPQIETSARRRVNVANRV